MEDGANAFARGRLVWLRAFEEEDLEQYLEAVNDRDVAGSAGYRFPQARDDVRSWYERRVKASGPDRFYVISPLGDRSFAGTIWLWNHDSRMGGPELSILIASPGSRGKGWGTDAVNAMLDLVFGATDTHRIWLATASDNVAAQRAFAKAGFQVEGTLRAHGFVRGAATDSVLMAILRDDWEKLDRPRSWEHDV